MMDSMGTVLAIYSEADRRFFRIATKLRLSPDNVRRTRATPFRYCLDGNDYFVVEDESAISQASHMCWARIPSLAFMGIDRNRGWTASA